MTARNVAWKVLFLFGVLISATGCTVFSSSVTESERLDDARYALCFSAPSREIDISGDGTFGRILLAQEDGQFSKVDTAGMDMCEIAWASDGLYFSDRLADYKLNNAGLQRTVSPKTDSQYSLLAVSPETVVGVYNLGYSDSGGYTSQVVEMRGTTSVLREVEGGYYVVSQCEGIVYGIGQATGRYSVTGDAMTEPILLNQLTGTPDGEEQNLGSTTLLTHTLPASDAPCLDGKIYFIADAGDGGSSHPASPVLSVWDTTTGEYEHVALAADPEVAALMANQDLGSPVVTSLSISDGKLVWYGANNLILSTDLDTGRTEALFEVEGTNNSSSSSTVVFTETEAVLLVDNNDGSPYRIVRYDRDTGKELGRTVLDANPNTVNGGFIFRDFAVRP